MKTIYKKGDLITVENDSILSDCMGLGAIVSGEVFVVDNEGNVKSFRCKQTGAIECVDDGKISLALH